MDNESDAVMMLMDLGMYEKMLENSSGIEKLTEEELLEKINRDVAIWRACNDNERAEIYDEVPAYVSDQEKAVVMSPFGGSPAVREKEKDTSLNFVEPAPITLNKYPSVNAEQEQSASDIVAEEEEEKFYLEPVE